MERNNIIHALADSIYSCGDIRKIVTALQDAYDHGMADEKLNAAEKKMELADKYAAALGREAELKERIRILESKMRPG